MKSILILIALLTFNLYAQKMPGEYINSNPINKILKEIEFRGDKKGGNYETYSIVGVPNAKEMKFLIVDDNKTTQKWFEMSVTTLSSGKIVLKLLTSKGLLKGKLLRLQLKYSKYYPFELDLSKNLNIQKEIGNSLIKNDFEKFKKERKFLRNDIVKISGKKYKVKVYKILRNKKEIEYALLEKEKSKIWGLAYLKVKGGSAMYLKDLGENAVSVFPRKVPKLDFMGKIMKMSEDYINREKMRKKALEREKKMESEGEEQKDDPIEKLNKMIEEEGN